MSKHTQGPWLLVEKEHTRGAHETQPHLEYFHIQGPQGDIDPDLAIAGFMKRADAKLIAAAPELLEALKDVLPLIKYADDAGWDIVKRARLAVEKATT